MRLLANAWTEARATKIDNFRIRFVMMHIGGRLVIKHNTQQQEASNESQVLFRRTDCVRNCETEWAVCQQFSHLSANDKSVFDAAILSLSRKSRCFGIPTYIPPRRMKEKLLLSVDCEERPFCPAVFLDIL
jgi:hypothetical protein